MKSLDELLEEHEDYDFEAKAAQGRHGRGEVPRSVWSTYSSMANTAGGLIVLGAEENEFGGFTAIGLSDFDKVRKDFLDGLHNREIVNTPLLRDEDVTEIIQDGHRLLCIYAPRATRKQRPVYVGANPLTGTYQRNYEGDYKCGAETVRRMMAEAVEDARDSRIQPGFGLEDLNVASLAAYRNDLKNTPPNRPFLAFDDLEFLRNLGGWAKDRQTGEEGLTIAGLLMFGSLISILDAVPHYVLDYQERPPTPSEQRWLDRVTTDFTCSGNLYDFYRRIYARLTADLKVPFRLQESRKRIYETHVHEALREALVNTMIHADFTDRLSILIVKQKGFFEFRNPGGLRMPIDMVLQGGNSDCRNRGLQKMFQLIGAAEQAGSGFPKILRAWKEQHRRYPLLDEKYQPDQTVLRLPTTRLLPPESVEQLNERFGQAFQEPSEVERLAVVTAFVENKVTNQRIRALTPTHTSDVTDVFKSLVHKGLLAREGVRWNTFYRLPASSRNQTQPLDNSLELSFDAAPNSGILEPNSDDHQRNSLLLPRQSKRQRTRQRNK